MHCNVAVTYHKHGQDEDHLINQSDSGSVNDRNHIESETRFPSVLKVEIK